MIEENCPCELDILTLHTPEGESLYLQRAFIISVLGPGSNRQHTKVTVDRARGEDRYEVIESLDEITGPFSKVASDLKINPAYFSGLVKNTEDNADKFPYKLLLRSPEASYFFMNEKPESIIAALKGTSKPGL